MTNKKDDIKSLAEGFFAPDVENKVKIITIEEFKDLMKQYIIDDKTAQDFYNQLGNFELNIADLDKEDYADKGDFLNQFYYELCDMILLDEAYLRFKNADEIIEFANSLDYENENYHDSSHEDMLERTGLSNYTNKNY